MTDCFLSAERLAAYADGSMAEAERAGAEGHLAECVRCREELAWLRTLAARTHALPDSIAPSRDLWAGIAPRLTPVRRQRVVSIHALTLAAAAVVLLLLTAGAVQFWLSRQGSFTPVAHQPNVPVQQNAAAGDPTVAVATLVAQVRSLEQVLPPATRALVTRQLAQIDAAIVESEKALAGQSDHAAIERMLEARYRQRLELLQQAGRVGRQS